MGSIRGEGGAGGGGGGGLADLVDDTTPQLGGNLDVNGFNVGGVTPTELGYLSGVSSAIQTQLNAKAASSHTHAQSDVTNLTSDLSAKAPLASPALTGTPTAPTAAADTNTTQIATTAFVLGQVSAAVAGLLDLKGSTDCSATPNYPAGSKGDSYIVSVAGKIGGASGKSVDVGDMYIASADNAGGTEASVGTSWFVVEHNLAGALLSANNLSDVASASTARTNLGAAASTDPTITGTLTVLKSGGTVGVDEVRITHDGNYVQIVNKNSSGSRGFLLVDNATNRFHFDYSAGRLCGWAGTSFNLGSSGFAGDAIGNVWLQSASIVSWHGSGLDTGIARNAAGVVEVNNGVAGTYRDFKARAYESTITTGTAPFTVASTTVVTNLNADKLDGKDATDFAPCTQATLTAAASVALDFAAAGLATLTTDQNTTFTTSNRAAGRQPYNLRIVGGGAHTLTFPAGWKWLNSTMPAAIASGKTGRLCLECYGSADTDVVASFAVEA